MTESETAEPPYKANTWEAGNPGHDESTTRVRRPQSAGGLLAGLVPPLAAACALCDSLLHDPHRQDRPLVKKSRQRPAQATNAQKSGWGGEHPAIIRQTKMLKYVRFDLS